VHPLEKLALYRQAPAHLRREITAEVRIASVPVGVLHCRQGEMCEHVTCVLAGSIRVFRLSPTGREVTIYHVIPGDMCVLSLVCAIAQVPFLACAQAESALEAALVRGCAFRDWLDRYEPLRRFAFEVVAARFSTVMQLVEDVAFGRMSRRVAEFILARFEANDQGPILSITHEEIAAELGSVREVISRVLKSFQRSGGIEVARGQVIVRDRSVLAGLAVEEPRA
jgi:CRP/FNR family transcriptional regulator, anaerobic regulatory protein